MRREKMNTYKKTAIWAGILFIIATAAALVSIPFLKSVDAADYMASVAANGTGVTIGVLLSFIAAAASAGIAISLYPVLKKFKEGLAMGAVGFRVIEAVFYSVAAVGLLVLLTLSRDYVAAGASGSGYYQTTGAVVLAGHNWAGNVGALLAFSVGALIYYSIFYQTRLIPRWLAGWGVIATIMCLTAAVLVMFNAIGPMSSIQVVLALPIAVQEMVLAVWLIVKGFNARALDGVTLKMA
jgi:hypothetical protein